MPYSWWKTLFARPRRQQPGGGRRPHRPQLEGLEGRVTPAHIYWTGTGATANFSDPANWRGGVVPGADDFATFDARANGPFANKDVLIDTPLSLMGLQVL